MKSRKKQTLYNNKDEKNKTKMHFPEQRERRHSLGGICVRYEAIVVVEEPG